MRTPRRRVHARCESPSTAREHLMSTTLDSRTPRRPGGEISGSVLGPQDAGYDAARAVHNGLVDRRPAADRPLPDDERRRRGARARAPGGLEVSIRGGGHNVAGRAVTDGGVMIDLAEMKAIAIDPDRATATAEGGVIWAELNDAAAEHGLAVTGGAVSGDGDRRLHARRRPRLADGQVRARGRQPARGRARHGRGRRAPRRRRVAPRSLLGASRRRRELRRRDVVHVPPAPGPDDRGRADRPSDRGRARPAALLPRRGGGRLGRPDRLRRARARAGRLRHEARGAGRLPHRRRRTRRSATSSRSRRGARR